MEIGQIGETVDTTPIGFKIYYSDESVYKSTGQNLGQVIAEFIQTQSDEILFVDVFFKGEYRTWKKDHWRVENYKESLATTDYYWWNAGKGKFEKGPASEIPPGLPRGILKVGKYVTDDIWIRVVNNVYADRKWL